MPLLREFFEKKYYPVFQGQWSDTKAYEALDVVDFNGSRYIAKIPVPAGTLVSNTNYWIKFIGSVNDYEDLLRKVNTLETTVQAQSSELTAQAQRITQLETDVTEIAVDMDNVNRDMRNLIAMLIGE